MPIPIKSIVSFQDLLHKFLPISTQIFAHLCECWQSFIVKCTGQNKQIERELWKQHIDICAQAWAILAASSFDCIFQQLSSFFNWAQGKSSCITCNIAIRQEIPPFIHNYNWNHYAYAVCTYDACKKYQKKKYLIITAPGTQISRSGRFFPFSTWLQ